MLKNSSLKVKLTLALLIAGALPAILISYLSYQRASESLLEEVESKLVAIREAKGFQIEELVELMITQAIHEIDIATQRNASLAADSSVRAEDLKSQSDQLSQIVIQMESIVYGKELKGQEVSNVEGPVLELVVGKRKKAS